MGLTVRDATPADYPTYARLFPALAVPDPVLSPADFEAEMLPRVIVVEDRGQGVGYASFRVYGTLAHVFHVVVDAAARGKGAGRALMEGLRARATASGCTRWYLNVKKDNGAAIRLYERTGLAPEASSWALRADWTALLALPGTSSPSRDGAPADDAALAARFGFAEERITLARTRPEAVTKVLGDPTLEGFAIFAPAFPGIYPLGVARPELARALFDALHPHARHAHVNVSVEKDHALADHLRAGGAELLFEIVRMGGAL